MLHFVASYLDPSLRSFAFVTSGEERKLFLHQVIESIYVLLEDTTQMWVVIVQENVQILMNLK